MVSTNSIDQILYTKRFEINAEFFHVLLGVCHVNMFSQPGLSSHPMENGEQNSDHEYYNDLQRELQPLQRNETTV